MQANVDLLLAKAGEIVALKKITARAFRESDDYPALVVYSREATDLKAFATNHRHYTGPWAYGIQVFESLNTTDNRDASYADFSSLEALVQTFVTKVLGAGNWEITRLEFFPAQIAGKQLAVADLELVNHAVTRYV